MLDLFRLEAEGQIAALTSGLLALEREPAAAEQLESCMRAAHSLKGAARIVGLVPGVAIAHAMEDCFVAAQEGALVLERGRIELLLHGVDLLAQIATSSEADLAAWGVANKSEIERFACALAGTLDDPPPANPAPAPGPAVTPLEAREGSERALRVTAGNLDRLLAAAAESLVESRRLKPFAASLLRLKRLQYDAIGAFDVLRDALAAQPPNERAESALAEFRRRALELHGLLSLRLAELENFDRRSTGIANRLYDEALACRMRPFADGTGRFPRLVRDLAVALGKNVRLEIAGERTWLDRDILERLEAPLGHLLRNAIDHGIETPQERRAAAKPAEGVLRLEASHGAGMLHVSLADDGGGIDLERVRAAVVERKLATPETAAKLSEAEVFQFLFLPGFSMKAAVTDVSGRGVGLDVVATMLKAVGGTAQLSSVQGHGTRFGLSLPLSLSVVRTLLVEVGGEPYAFPLAHIVRTHRLRQSEVASIEGREFFSFDDVLVGLVSARRVLLGDAPASLPETLDVVVVGGPGATYGVAVDRFLGEGELVVQLLDRRLAKIENIAAGALMEDGAPVLILDVEDMLRSLEKLVAVGHRSALRGATGDTKKRKRVLVVDDSLTVRELQRSLLAGAGYEVEVAVNGMDGWNSVRSAPFDLIVTDVDMPRMDGIELVIAMKADARLRELPVIIVSYKDRDEDRRRGLEAGADYFLSKGNFHDETLLTAVVDLIGAAAA